MNDLREEFGRVLTARQVAEVFGLSANTVRINFHLFGGMRVSPGGDKRRGRLVFFENRIREIINANTSQELGHHLVGQD